MQRKINAGTAVLIFFACSLLLGLWIHLYLENNQVQLFGEIPPPPPPQEIYQSPKNPKSINLSDIHSLFENERYRMISKNQILALGAEVEQYVPQMIKALQLHDYHFHVRRGRSGTPPSHRVLVWAGEYSLPSLIELLDEDGIREMVLNVLAEMGSEAQPALPKLTELLQAESDLRGTKQTYFYSQIQATMNSIKPGAGNAEVKTALKQAFTWKMDIQARLAQKSTRDSAFIEAMSELSGDNLTQRAAAVEVLLDAEFSGKELEALLASAKEYWGGMYVSLDQNGSINYEYRKHRLTPRFYAICRVLDAHMGSAHSQLHDLLAEPGHPFWPVAANAEVLYGNPDEHLEDFVNGFMEVDNQRWHDMAYDYLMENRQRVIPLLVKRFKEQDYSGHSQAALIIKDMHIPDAHPKHGYADRLPFNIPNQAPIIGLDEVIPELLLTSRREESGRLRDKEIIRETLFLMRFLEHPGSDVIERLILWVDRNGQSWTTLEARIAFETLYTMVYNDPAITEFALAQINHLNEEHRHWAAKILGLKGANDPRTVAALTELLADTDERVALEAKAALALPGENSVIAD